MVEIFKTNVRGRRKAEQLVNLLSKYLPACKINFDLYDSDKVLRIEGKDIEAEQVPKILQKRGFICKIIK